MPPHTENPTGVGSLNQMMRATFDNAPDAIYWISEQGRILYANRRASEMLGYTLDELTAMTVHDLDPEFTAEIWPHHWAELQQAIAITVKTRHLTKGGELIPVEVSTNYMEVDGQAINCGFARDMRTRLVELETLNIREMAIEASIDPIVIADARQPDMPLIYVNPAFTRQTGYTAEEAIGRNCRFLQGEDRDQPALDELRAALREGRECVVELRNYRKNGELFWNELQISPVYNDAGELTHFIGVQYNITDRKLAAERLQHRADANLLLSQITSQSEGSTFSQLTNALQMTNNLLGTEHSWISQFTGESYLIQEVASQNGELLCSLNDAYPAEQTFDDLVHQQGHLLVLEQIDKTPYRTSAALEAFPIAAYLGAPIIVDSEFYGTLSFASTHPRTETGFSNSDQEYVTLLASWMGTMLSRQRSNDALTQALDETETLYRLTSALNRARTAEELLETAIHPIMGASIASLLLVEVNPQNKPEALTVMANWSNTGQPSPIAPGSRYPLEFFPATSLWINESVPQLVGDIEEDPRFDDAGRAVFSQIGAEAAVMSPLKLGERWVGMLSISWPYKRSFNDLDARQYLALSSQMSIALDNLLLAEQAKKRAAQLAIVAEVGQVITSIVDVNELLSQVTNLTKERFDLYHTHIYVYDPTRQILKLAAGAGEIGRQMVAEGREIPFTQAESIVAQVARTRQTLIRNDVRSSQTGFLPHPLLYKTAAEMAVPIIVGQELLGVLDVQADRVNAFTAEDAQIQETLASGIAVALQNAHRFEQTEAEKAQSQAILNSVSIPMIISRLSDGQVLYANQELANLAELTLEEMIGNQTPNFYVNQEDRAQYISQIRAQGYVTNFEVLVQSAKERQFWALVSGRIFRYQDQMASISTLLDMTVQKEAERTLSDQAAFQLRQAQFESIRGQLSSEFLNLEAAELDAGIQRALHSVGEFARVDRAYVFSFLPGTELMSNTHEWCAEGVDSAMATLQNLPQEAFPYLMSFLRRPATFVVPRVADLPAEAHVETAEFEVEGIQSLMCAPLLVDRHLIGFVGFDAVHEERPWREDEIALLDLASNIISLAFSRQQTDAALRKQATEMATVSEVASAINTILDTQELLQTVVDLTKERFNLYHAHIFLLNDTRDTVALTAGAGEIGQKMVAEGRRFALNSENSLVATVARTGQGQIRSYSGDREGFMPHPLLVDTRAELAVPIMTGNEVMGVLDVRSDQLNYFGAADLAIQSTLAAQVAVALRNARLFEQSEAARQDMSLLTRRLTREGWDGYLGTGSVANQTYLYDAQQAAPASTVDEVRQALQVQGEAIGQIVVRHPQVWDTEAQEIMAAVADQLSAHLETLRLTDQTQTALAQTATLYDASTRLNSAQSLDDVLQVLSEQSLVLEGMVNMSINYFEPLWTETTLPDWVIVLGRKSHLPTTAVRPRYPVSAFPSAVRLLGTEQTLLIPDIANDKSLDEPLRQLYTQQFQGVSTIFVPLIVAGQRLGYLNVIFNEPTSFPTPLVNQFENVVQQAAVTIQGIYLNEQREKAHLQTEALYEGSSRVVRATSVKDVLAALVQSSALQRMDRASIFYFNRPWEETRAPDTTQVLAVWEREPGTTRLPIGTIYPYTEFHNQQFSRTEPRVYRDAQLDERVSPNTKTLLHQTGMRGLMYLPLVVNEAWVGVVAITSQELMEVSDEELRQLISLTSQASVVLANRRLLTEAQARADRERQVRAITDRIRRGGDRESILEIAREEIAGLLKASSTVVQLGTKEQLLETMKQDRG